MANLVLWSIAISSRHDKDGMVLLSERLRKAIRQMRAPARARNEEVVEHRDAH
jgi:hypothetical protein